MSALDPLRQHREALWHLELAGWLHNLGKMHPEFVSYQCDNSSTAYRYEFITGKLIERFPPGSAGALDEPLYYERHAHTAKSFRDFTSGKFEAIFAYQIALPGCAPTTLGEVVELQDLSWHTKPADAARFGATTPLWAHLLAISHRQASGGDKTEVDREVAGISKPRKPVRDALRAESQPWPWSRASAFGFESPLVEGDYHSACAEVAGLIRSKGPAKTTRDELFRWLNVGMAESQRPLHDIRIGDMGKMAAAFLKAQAARFLIEKPQTRDALRWRLVRFAVDGPGYVERVSRIPDILARRELVDKHLNQIRECLENSTPLGNEVYRDEYGSVFVLADYANTVDQDPRLRLLLNEALPPVPPKDEPCPPNSMYSDFAPEIQIGTSFAMGEHGENSFVLARLLYRDVPPARPRPATVQSRWYGQVDREICTVCGTNPVASKEGKPHAFAQRACGTCFDLRVGRSREWLSNLDSTIWLDEIGDVNGRIALLVARLRLGPWLTEGLPIPGTNQINGNIHRTLVMANPKDHPIVMRGGSAARISRIWETCRDFWQESLDKFRADEFSRKTGRVRLLGDLPEGRPFQAGQAFVLVHAALKISVVYEKPGCLLVTDHLERLARLAGEAINWAAPREFALEEPTGYGSPDKPLGVFRSRGFEFDPQPYAPILPILADPQLCMVLIPGDRAMDFVTQLQEDYALQMAKVRPVLGLDLGLVWAPLETPIYALLDAGRRLLRRKLTPQDVAQSDLGFKLDKDPFHLVPRVSGDPVPVSQLTDDELLAVEPSTFDYEFLESAGRRFELAYTDEHARRGAEVSHRPYPLAVLGQWTETRNLLVKYLHLGDKKKAKLHQIKALDGILEAKRQLWQSSWKDLDETFIYWALLNVEWSGEPSEEELQTLVRSIRRGIFADLLEVELGILKAGRQKEIAHVS